jgi:hypothetical protein
MEPFMKLPWWAQIVFVATNGFVVFILVILIRQVVTTNKSRISNLFAKKKIKAADKQGKGYGGAHSSSYIDA